MGNSFVTEDRCKERHDATKIQEGKTEKKLNSLDVKMWLILLILASYFGPKIIPLATATFAAIIAGQ